MNEVVISVGSNINPNQNVIIAQEKLSKSQTFVKASQFYVTKPLGFTQQADFLNGSYLIQTQDDFAVLRQKLKQIEIEMGRVKTENKNAARTIDLDIVVWNRKIIDEDFYHRDFIKKTVLELIPDLKFDDH